MTHASCQASKISTLFTWWASQNWSSVKVKCIKNLEGFGLEWHTRGHRSGLWQDKYGHVDIQSLGLLNYCGILLPVGIESLFYPRVWWLFAPKRIACTGISLESVLYSLLTADAIMPLTCFCNLCTGNYEPWEPDLGREGPCPRESSG